MATYSVNNIKIDNGLFFTPGPTAGYVLSINSSGSTSWITPQSGSSGSAGTSGSSGTSGVNGQNGQSSSLFLYKAKTNAYTNNPGNSYILWNNATQTGATAIHINHLTQNNLDIDIFLALIRQGSNLTIQHQTNSSEYQTWDVIGTPTLVSGADNYWIIPVSLINSTISFTNNNDIFVAISADSGTSGSSGVNGSSGSSGTSGLNGSSGTSGAGSSGTSGVNGAIGATGSVGAHVNFPTFVNRLKSNAAFGLAANPTAAYHTDAYNTAIIMPFIPASTFTFSSISCYATVHASSTFKFFCYSYSGGAPSTKLFETAYKTTTANGTQTISQSFTFSAGTVYWLGYGFSTANATARFAHLPKSSMLECGFDGTQFQTGNKGTLANPMATTWSNVAATNDGFMLIWFEN